MQKKWRKKLKQAERAQQAKTKAEALAKLRDPAVKSGFRKIHIDTTVYLWRYYGGDVEIRLPNGKKWVIPIWEIQGLSKAEWEKEHEDCWEECSAFWIQPSLVRDAITARLRLC